MLDVILVRACSMSLMALLLLLLASVTFANPASRMDVMLLINNVGLTSDDLTLSV
ncbi:hypothetical protein DPMN_005206 [Dreissena polymorpha]|uniref:Uncharacterized protein n=1 Tax=Dreissena polymorpha TaxID=45954 RepID=A0A9D4RTN9_DREPO|nr:hypothetical protein DPMN_005206 [Dreissena polymorpha]